MAPVTGAKCREFANVNQDDCRDGLCGCGHQFASRDSGCAGLITNSSNNHVYYLLTSSSWTDSEAEALSLGGHIVTINDLQEKCVGVHKLFNLRRCAP
jgi:hypothetical protein